MTIQLAGLRYSQPDRGDYPGLQAPDAGCARPVRWSDRFPHRMNVALRRIGTVSAQSHVERRGDEEHPAPLSTRYATASARRTCAGPRATRAPTGSRGGHMAIADRHER